MSFPARGVVVHRLTVLLLLLQLQLPLSSSQIATTKLYERQQSDKSDNNSSTIGPLVKVGGLWHSASEPVIDYEQWTESVLLFRVAGVTNATATSLQAAYWASAGACRSQLAGARLLHRDLLLAPAVLHLMLGNFGLSSSSSSSSSRFIFFADDNPSEAVTSVWAAEWLPARREATFVQLPSAGYSAGSNDRDHAVFHPVHLCHQPQARLLPQPHPSSSELNHPVALLSVAASVLCCLLLCASLWLFVRVTRRLRRIQAHLTATYRALDAGGSICSSSTLGARVRYNGSTSLVNCSSIEARLERERRSNYYY